MSKIKICGLTWDKDIEYVNELQPDYIGFVFADSRRHVDDYTAKKLKSMLSPRIKAAGVFVNDSAEHIAKLCREGTIDIVQLHGDEDEQFALNLKENIDCSIIRAVRVRNTDDIKKFYDYPCDYLLLDTFTDNTYGGSGKTFDRSLIPKDCKEYFLAGGLNEKNLAEAISECRPYAVDLSSGVETDGFKDKEKIQRVIEIVRSTGGKNE